MSSKFELLRNRKIIDILIGDSGSLPYLSGPNLCKISTLFGLPASYSWQGGALSRWQYMDNLLGHCIKENKCPALLTYLFDKKQFTGIFQNYPGDIQEAIKDSVEKSICAINQILFFSDHELVAHSNEYIIQGIETKPEINVIELHNINQEYIKNIAQRAFNDIDEQNLDSAVTKARTLLEEVFCFVIEKKDVSPDNSGDIHKLHKQVKELYNMKNDPNLNRLVNQLLSGLNTIVSAVGEMRNKFSDSHGVGSVRICIKDYHARLVVNSAVTLAEFILSVSLNAENEN